MFNLAQGSLTFLSEEPQRFSRMFRGQKFHITIGLCISIVDTRHIFVRRMPGVKISFYVIFFKSENMLCSLLHIKHIGLFLTCTKKHRPDLTTMTSM